MKCLILSFSDTEYSVQSMIKIGANGCILKSCSSHVFKEALVSVYKKTLTIQDWLPIVYTTLYRTATSFPISASGKQSSFRSVDQKRQIKR